MNTQCSCGVAVSCQVCRAGGIGHAPCWACTQQLCDEACGKPPVEPCDCNCDQDCPDCELCGADGKCYPDPNCEKECMQVQAYAIVNSRVAECSAANIGCQAGDTNARENWGGATARKGDSVSIGTVPVGSSGWTALSGCDVPCASSCQGSSFQFQLLINGNAVSTSRVFNECQEVNLGTGFSYITSNIVSGYDVNYVDGGC